MSWLPEDVVLFHIGDQPWLLSATVAVVGVLLTIVWAVLIATVFARRSGNSRRLSGSEAGQLMGSDTTALATYGATGKEWKFSFSVEDLRAAWHEGNYSKFFGFPAFHAAGICSITAPMFAMAIYTRAEIVVWIVGSFVALMFASYLFGMWAALFTKLR
jgi:hypothetical protein